MNNNLSAVIATRTADLRIMLDQGWDHYEGIDMDDALRELLDMLDSLLSKPVSGVIVAWLPSPDPEEWHATGIFPDEGAAADYLDQLPEGRREGAIVVPYSPLDPSEEE